MGNFLYVFIGAGAYYMSQFLTMIERALFFF